MASLRKKTFTFDLVSPSQYQRGGVYEDAAFSAQPRGTTRFAMNFRPFCAKTGLRRLSRRAGMTQFASLTGRVQNLNHVFTGHAVTESDTKGREMHIAGVSGGVIRKIASNGAVTASAGQTLSSTAPVVFSTSYGEYLFYVDGTRIVRWNPATNTSQDLVAHLGIVGAPTGVRLIATWRGRLVVVSETNWFMSAVNDPLDWDYGPVPATATQAVAGNTAPAGQVPDVVTTIIPLSDDKLLFGCDHSLYVMRGDPAAGGRIDLFEGDVGMSFGAPWCRDSLGGIYFYGSRGGVFYMNPGTFAISRISEGVESRLRDVPGETTLVRLAYNDREQGVHVFFSGVATGSGNTHLFYDVRTRTWWLDSIGPGAMDVVSPHTVDGDGATDRLLLMGDSSGSVLIWNPDVETDNGNYFPWVCWFGPISYDNGRHGIIDEVEAVFGEQNCRCNWDFHTGETAEQAYASQSRVAGIWQGRDRFIDRYRLSGNYLFLKISNRTQAIGSDYVTLENLRVVMRESGQPSYRLRR